MKSSLKVQKIKDRYYIPSKIVMLPTNHEASLKGNELWINIEGKLKLSKPNSICPGPQSFQHLYIISDEEIKEENCYLKPNDNNIWVRSKNSNIITIRSKKIIATTNKSLGLPEPSQSFIKAYIEEYNKGNVITDVLVEYKDYCDYNDDNPSGYVDVSDWRLVVDTYNTITIKKVKDSWSREEVEKLLFQYDTFILNYHTETQELPLQKDIDKWIAENLY